MLASKIYMRYLLNNSESILIINASNFLRVFLLSSLISPQKYH